MWLVSLCCIMFVNFLYVDLSESHLCKIVSFRGYRGGSPTAVQA